MQRKRDGLVPIDETLSDLDVPVTAIPAASPQARHRFTLAGQVNALVSASEADPDLGFMARLLALCRLAPRQPRQPEGIPTPQRHVQAGHVFKQ